VANSGLEVLKLLSRRLACAIVMPVALASNAFAQSGPFQEAPMLSTLVSQGKLPTLSSRLPEEPAIVVPHERIGVYGGVWRVGLLGASDGTGLLRMVGYDGMMSWKPDWSEPFPNIARAVDVSQDARTYVFHLRKGMKWSDGSPFTAEDIVFGLEDITLNRQIQPLLPGWYRAGGADPSIEAIDPLTVKIVFKSGMSLFLDYLATAEGQEVGLYQKKYCSQFLPKYNSQADDDAKAEGFANWVQRVSTKCGRRERASRWSTPERPTINAWMVEQPYLSTASEVVLVRNPYYWKVDSNGNQLPYIDRVIARVRANVEGLALLAMTGQIDMQDRHIGSSKYRTILENAQEKSNFRFYETVASVSNTTVVSFNHNNTDIALRKIFEDKNFRIGISHAINRQAIVDVVHKGRSKPAQVGPLPGSQLHNRDLSEQYLAHDLKLARDALDQVKGLRALGDGRYGLPDGTPLTISIDVVMGVFPEWAHTLDMMKTDLAKLGIDLRLNALERAEFTRRYETNEFEAQVWGGDGGWDAILQPRWYFPSDDESRWAPLWALWYLNPTALRAESPPARVQYQMSLYQTLLRSRDKEERNSIMRRILEATRDEFPVIGIGLPENGFGIVRNDFHNVPKSMPFAWTYPNPGPVRPEQFFTTRNSP